MSRFIRISFVAMLMGGAVSVSAQSAQSQGATSIEDTVNSLMEMSRQDRVAALKAMSPEERVGVWYAAKRAEMGNPEPARDYADRQAPGSAVRERSPVRKRSTATRAIGMITYDDNVVTTTFGGGQIIGNRFDTHTGLPVFTSGTVTTIQAVVAQGPAFPTTGTGVPSAGFVLLGPQTVGGGAMAIFSTFSQPTGTTATTTYTGLAVNYTGSSFFVLFGDFASSYVPAFGTGTNNSQGHHGVVGYTGGMGPNITSTFNFGNSLNGLVRATGNIVPVELMTFDVD